MGTAAADPTLPTVVGGGAQRRIQIPALPQPATGAGTSYSAADIIDNPAAVKLIRGLVKLRRAFEECPTPMRGWIVLHDNQRRCLDSGLMIGVALHAAGNQLPQIPGPMSVGQVRRVVVCAREKHLWEGKDEKSRHANRAQANQYVLTTGYSMC